MQQDANLKGKKNGLDNRPYLINGLNVTDRKLY